MSDTCLLGDRAGKTWSPFKNTRSPFKKRRVLIKFFVASVGLGVAIPRVGWPEGFGLIVGQRSGFKGQRSRCFGV